MEVRLPPLRERLDDLPALIDHFFKIFLRSAETRQEDALPRAHCASYRAIRGRATCASWRTSCSTRGDERSTGAHWPTISTFPSGRRAARCHRRARRDPLCVRCPQLTSRELQERSELEAARGRPRAAPRRREGAHHRRARASTGTGVKAAHTGWACAVHSTGGSKSTASSKRLEGRTHRLPRSKVRAVPVLRSTTASDSRYQIDRRSNHTPTQSA